MEFNDIYKGFQFVAVVARINEGNQYYIVDAKDPDLIKFLRDGDDINFDDMDVRDVEKIPDRDGLYEVLFEIQSVDEDDEIFVAAILEVTRLRWYANLEAQSPPRPEGTVTSQQVDLEDEDEEVAQAAGGGLGAFRFS